MPGQGFSNEYTAYQFIDRRPANGINYYRLKQVDTDGTHTYSQIVALDFGRSIDLEVYPNPSNGEFRLQFQGWHGEQATVKVCNLWGETIFQGAHRVTSQVEDIALNLKGQPAGVYAIFVTCGVRGWNGKVILMSL